MKKYYKQLDNEDLLIAAFPVQYIKLLELTQNGRPTDNELKLPCYKYLIRNGRKEKVNFNNLLSNNEYIRHQQYYLMQISYVTTNPIEVKDIYKNWDWNEFIIYQQSILSTKTLKD